MFCKSNCLIIFFVKILCGIFCKSIEIKLCPNNYILKSKTKLRAFISSESKSFWWRRCFLHSIVSFMPIQILLLHRISSVLSHFTTKNRKDASEKSSNNHEISYTNSCFVIGTFHGFGTEN